MTRVIGNWWNSEEVRNSRRALVLILAFFILVWFYKHGEDSVSIRNDGYLLNIHTEVFGVALGAVVTIFVIDRLYERQRKLNLIDRLLYDARSTEPAVSKRAFEDMKYHRLIYGEKSILQKANLRGASPGKVTINNANLHRAYMLSSDFTGSIFSGAVLDDAFLVGARLEKASFRDASLRNADLREAKLNNAYLMFANLEGANLMDAELEQVHFFMKWLGDLDDAKVSVNAPRQLILPDTNPADIDTDFARFTNPNHPEFWRSDDPESPAYIGKYKEDLAFIRSVLDTRSPPPAPPPAFSDSV